MAALAFAQLLVAAVRGGAPYADCRRCCRQRPVRHPCAPRAVAAALPAATRSAARRRRAARPVRPRARGKRPARPRGPACPASPATPSFCFPACKKDFSGEEQGLVGAPYDSPIRHSTGVPEEERTKYSSLVKMREDGSCTLISLGWRFSFTAVTWSFADARFIL